MKKITLSVAVLLGSLAAKSQTEYIDLTTKGIFNRSEMVVYNDEINYEDLEYLYIGKFNDNYHWVEYTNDKKMNFNVVITMSDNQGDTRELCTKKDDEEAKCRVVDAFATQYKLKVEGNKYEIFISKPNVN